ncbi:MAG TPA: DUF2256 domain-containing protein [Phycisphaerales bacterium]|nr:DUF2256 domain-containing protein [Phycisphaerales bacterium]
MKKKRFNKKDGLPEKICLVCGRPFSYRRKWKDDWDEVKYCSQRCRNRRNQGRIESESS